MSGTNNAEQVSSVRHFNRFYTQQIGVLSKGMVGSPFGLTEARVLYELAQVKNATATEIRTNLNLDPGYLSRILRKFEADGLLEKSASKADGRQSLIELTGEGKRAFDSMNLNTEKQISEMLESLTLDEQKRLVSSMGTIEALLSERAEKRVPYILRPHQHGDMGYLVHRHGIIYAEEFNWNEQFEAVCATIVAEYLETFDPSCERTWIAEMDGEIVGSVFIARDSERVARLRLLIVESKARGLGLGTHLVDECIKFSKRVGYDKITLWTMSMLVGARKLYENAGFELIDEEPVDRFGHKMMSQTWDLVL
jgi:DNA-binding MarR family transcriptional regulator/GNAT superfamily N-acetyltransferase